MRRVKEILRLAHELGYSLRQIGKSVRLGRTSVWEYLTRAEAAGVRYEDIADKSEAEIEALLFKRPDLPASRPQPNWATVAADLRKPAVTLQLLWQEYRDQHPDGYSYSQFRRLYREHLQVTPEPRMRRTLTPAEMCEVDYAGMTMPVVTADGERQVSVFGRNLQMLPVEPPELAVAIAVRVLIPVFLPQQLQRYRRLTQIRRNRRPVRLGARSRGIRALEQQRLDLRFTLIGDVLVTHTGRFGARQILPHRGAAQPHRLPAAAGPAQFVGQPQYLFHASHVRPFPRHSPPQAKAEEKR